MSLMEVRKIRITLITDLLGSSPLNPDTYKDYIVTKKTPELEPEKAAEEIAGIESALGFSENEQGALEKGMTGFFRDDDGIYIMDYQFKGMLKNAANILKDALGLTALKSQMENYVFVTPRNIRLQNSIDGVLQRPLRAMTMQGPRVTLAASQLVNAGLQIEIQIQMLQTKDINWRILENCLDYGFFCGIGQWRGGGYGRFTWEYVDGNAPDETPFVNKSADTNAKKAAKKAKKTV